MRVLLRLILVLVCFQLQISISVAKTTETPDNEDKCKRFAESRRRDGFLVRKDVKEYCENACTTLPGYTCPEHDEITKTFDFTNTFERRMEVLFNASKAPDDNWFMAIDADTLFTSVWFFVPWLYGLLYTIIGSQWNTSNERHGRFPLIAINLMLFTGYLFALGSNNKYALVFNVLQMSQSSLARSSYHIFQDVAAIAILIIGLVCSALMVSDLLGQFILGVLGLCGFVVIIYRKVSNSRREDFFNIASLLLTMKMCADYCQLVFMELAVRNPTTLFVRHFVMAMLPWEGRYTSFLNNMNYSSGQLATEFIGSDAYGPGLLYIFFLGLISYAFVFIAIRCCLGLIILRKMNADFTLDLVWTGFYSYSIDVLNPFMIVFMGLAKRDSRMLFYALIMCTFNIGEFFTAREFFMLRCFLTLLDYLVIRSGLSGVYRFLEYDVDLGGMVFEKPGAFPYFYLDGLMDIKKHCVVVYVDSLDAADNVVSTGSGVALIRKSNCGPRLVTAHHVLKDKDVIRTEDERINERIVGAEALGVSLDPPVSMRLSEADSDGTEVRDLASNEIKSIKHLFVLSPSGATCVINDWSISRGDIYAAVNLRSGDSGSPVIAVLSSGVCVLAGVVSRGDPSEGSRNLISAINKDSGMRGSPGIGAPYFEVDSHLLNSIDFSVIEKEIRELRQPIAEFSDEFPEYFVDLDFDRGPKDAEPWRHDPDDGENVRKRKKGKVKSRMKDRRAAKMQFMKLLDAFAFDERSRQALSDYADGGPIVKFNALRRKQKRKMF